MLFLVQWGVGGGDKTAVIHTNLFNESKLSAPPKLTARIRVVGTLSDTFTAHSRFCLADEWFNKKYWQLEPNCL